MLIGVLLDISTFMQQKYHKFDEVLSQHQKSCVQYIAEILQNMSKYTLSTNHSVFMIGFGYQKILNPIDILSLIKLNQINMTNEEEHDQLISKSLKLLSESGASCVCRWTNQKTVYRKFQRYLSKPLYSSLKSDPKFLEQVIQILPKSMKQQSFSSYFFDGYQTLNQMLLNLPPNLSLILRKITGVSYYEQFKQQKLIEITTKIKKQLQLKLLKTPSNALYNCAQVVSILKRNNKQSQIRVRNQQLISQVRSFFDQSNRSASLNLLQMKQKQRYNTSLKRSLELIFPCFSDQNLKQRKKLLFVISDNHISDEGCMIAKKLQNHGVTIISICINSKSQSNLLNLYSEIQPHWTEKTRSLFNIASPYKVMQLPGTVFLGKGWQHNIMNRKQVKLFLEINNPRQMENLFKFSEGIISHYNFFENIDASKYQNPDDIEYVSKSTQTVRGVCYASASAALIHLAINRIKGRTGGYPRYEDIKDKIIEKYGVLGANTLMVLQDVCPKYRLRFNKVKIGRAIIQKRPLVARFQLTQSEWKTLREFYINNPRGVLTSKQLDISKRNLDEKRNGHAVILASFNTSCTLLMDCNGIKYNDEGYFRIDKPETLNMQFYDIFWELEDLTEQQKLFFALKKQKQGKSTSQ